MKDQRREDDRREDEGIDDKRRENTRRENEWDEHLEEYSHLTLPSSDLPRERE